MARVRTNPEMPPAPALAAGAALVAGTGWFLYRNQQRSKLTELLQLSPTVQEATARGLIFWTPSDKASEMIGYLDTTGVDTAFAMVQAELRLLMPEDASPGIVQDVTKLIEQQTGVDTSGWYESLPDVPGVDAGAISKWIFGS